MAIASSPQQAKAASCSLWLADVLKLLAKYSVIPNLGIAIAYSTSIFIY
ncbi:MAG: hypothetical protein ICV78_23760 [Tolypothrix sp. Co-bin9]|nr:hypothetical protein [Tolypothrix sp. Co-bin9]